MNAKNIWNLLKPYLFSTLIVFVAYFLKLFTPHEIITQIPFLLFFSAVVISGIYAGFFVGLYATLLSAAISYYAFLPPEMSFTKVGWHQDFKIVLYIIDCITMASLCGKLKKSQLEADRRRREADKLNIQLEKALRVRDDFLSIASHEMKTPLTSLKLQSQLFLRKIQKETPGALSQESSEKFALQTNNVIGKLDRLIDDMLDVSRLRSGNLSIRLEEVDLTNLVRTCIDPLSLNFIQQGKPKPILNLQGALLVNCDRLRMEQVILNLLSNALRYGGAEPVEVSLQNKGTNIQLSVTDKGEGIAQDKLEVIFDRFERAKDIDITKGLGLGLFISQQIIHAHGGKIWAESSPEKGTRFIVEIPKLRA